MIRSHRLFEVPALRARHELVAWVERHARLHVFSSENLVCDDRLFQRAFGRADAGERSLVTLVLSGTLHLECDGCIVRCVAGEGTVLARKGMLAARTEGAAYRSLVLEWDPDRAIEAPPRRLTFDPVPLTELADRIATAPRPERTLLEEALERMTTVAGLDPIEIERVSTLGPGELRAQEVADALDAVLSALDTQPMASDLETRLGVSSRQVTRLVDSFRARYGYGATNWQQTRGRRRLMLAASLLTAPGATVAEAARAVGYLHPETLSRAFVAAGFPRPSEVRAEVDALGAAWTREAEGAA